MSKPEIQSGALLQLLRTKHSEDVYVEECKTGPSQYADRCPRIDAWVMNKSWANRRVIAYEVKVSRSDFLRDKKWPDYLPFCNELYFVVPKGMVSVSEIPAECGLLEASTNVARLITKKAASYRSVEIPDSIYRYILMSRARIGAELATTRRGEQWIQWLKDRQRDKEIGWEVANFLGNKTMAIHRENQQLKQRQEELEARVKEVREVCDRYNVHLDWGAAHNLEEKIRGLQKILDGSIESHLRRVLDDVNLLKKHLITSDL